MHVGAFANATISGTEHGINVDNAGGALTINALGSSTGGTGDGIYAVNQASATSLAITAKNAEGVNGINARNFGTGAISVTTTGW